MPRVGVEPTILTEHGPKPCAYASSATAACFRISPRIITIPSCLDKIAQICYTLMFVSFTSGVNLAPALSWLSRRKFSMVSMKRFVIALSALLIFSSAAFAQVANISKPVPVIKIIGTLAGDTKVFNDANVADTVTWQGQLNYADRRAAIDEVLKSTAFEARDDTDGIHLVNKTAADNPTETTEACAPGTSSIECISLQNMKQRRASEAARLEPGCGPNISWIECASYSSRARHAAEVRTSSYGWSPSLASGWSPFNRGYDGYWWGCPSGIPNAELPPECMGAIKFRIGKLTGINLEEVDCRIDGRKCPAVGAHARWWQSKMTLPPGDHHIVLLTKTGQIRMFEDMITVHPLLQTGNKAFEVTISDADFKYGLFTGTVIREHRTVKAGELLKR